MREFSRSSRKSPTKRLRVSARSPLLVGIDTGGTFTDLIAVRGASVWTHKLPSTPHDPSKAVVRGLAEMLGDRAADLITYSSTVATNALLERRGARVVLLTTEGFEDVLEIGRQDRPNLYALEPQRVVPLVPHDRRLGATERMQFDGTPLLRLTPSAVRRVTEQVAALKPEAVAICLLHSYANPAHEKALAAAIARRTRVPISVSHKLVPEHREYERTSTTVINAYVAPIMAGHLDRLARSLSPAQLRIMQSSGGAVAPEVAGREPVRTALSGPAGGVIGACRVAAALKLDRIITFDMGGTSTDVALIDGQPVRRAEWTIGGLPLKVPALDIHTVGAGGGSLARVDAGGALRVGPESAGADPGPACYGRGRQPTVTDANLVLGRLASSAFLDGRMTLDASRARDAFVPLAKELRLPVRAAAQGVVRVANAAMERAVRAISIERGYDPRNFALVAFGGAAGQHACELAEALGVRRVIVPSHPGLLSAWGCALADSRRDYSHAVRLRQPTAEDVRPFVERMKERAVRDFRHDGSAGEPKWECSVDLRYVGQSHEIEIPVGARLASDFHAAHRRLYGYSDEAREIEATAIRLAAIARPVRRRRPQRVSFAGQRTLGRQPLWNGRAFPSVEIVARSALRLGERIAGPVLVAELSSTTYVAPGWTGIVRADRHLEMIHGD